MRVKDKSELTGVEILETFESESEFIDELEQNAFIPVPTISEERQKQIEEERKRLKAERKKAEIEAQEQRQREKVEAEHKLEMERIEAERKATALENARKIKKIRRRDKIWGIFWKIVIGAVIVAFCNPSVRERVPIVTRNLGEFVQALLSGERTTSNKAAESLRKLGKELNEINGYDYGSDSTEEGFNIDNAD